MNLRDYKLQMLSTVQLLDAYWGWVEPYIQGSFDSNYNDELTTKHVYDSICAGQMFAFVATSRDMESQEPDVPMVIVFDIAQYPKYSAMNIVALGGNNLAKCFALFWDFLVGWCYTNGASAIECHVSPAMERLVQRVSRQSKHKLKPTYRFMRLNLLEADNAKEET
jgi:hypothetical protein